MEKLLTVIVPTYNMEALLKRCLNSVCINDTALEIVVIIDGATDRSSEIAHEYQDKYPQIFRIIEKENGNYGSCINRGLAEAKGKYIKVLDADDLFNTEALTALLFFLKDSDADLVITNYCICNAYGEIIDLPFPQISPYADEEELELIASQLLQILLAIELIIC